MKRGTTLSMALILSVTMLSLIRSDSTASAQRPQKCGVESGILTLPVTQLLRITVNAGVGNDAITVRFRQMEYMQSVCNGAVCKYTVTAQTTSDSITLGPNEGISLDFVGKGGATAFRGIVLSNSPNVEVNELIIDVNSGEVLSVRKPASAGKLNCDQGYIATTINSSLRAKENLA
jgi:hypothetical protein